MLAHSTSSTNALTTQSRPGTNVTPVTSSPNSTATRANSLRALPPSTAIPSSRALKIAAATTSSGKARIAITSTAVSVVRRSPTRAVPATSLEGTVCLANFLRSRASALAFARSGRIDSISDPVQQELEKLDQRAKGWILKDLVRLLDPQIRVNFEDARLIVEKALAVRNAGYAEAKAKVFALAGEVNYRFAKSHFQIVADIEKGNCAAN